MMNIIEHLFKHILDSVGLTSQFFPTSVKMSFL